MGCERGNRVGSVNNEDYLKNIVKRSFQKSSSKESFDEYSKDFAKLNAEELMYVNRLLLIEFLKEEGYVDSIKIDSLVNIKIKNQKKILDLSMKLYGKPYNQIGQDELSYIMKQLGSKNGSSCEE